MKLWKLSIVVALALVLIVPFAAYAAVSMFADVPNDHIFVNDINWMKTAGVTNGCGDGTNYCPEDDVTRGQMAAFMHRLATGRSVDAGTLDGEDSTDYVRNTEWVKKGVTLGIGAGASAFATVTCPLPKHVVSGGGHTTDGRFAMIASHPDSGDTAWTITWTNVSSSFRTSTLTVYALCEGSELHMIP